MKLKNKKNIKNDKDTEFQKELKMNSKKQKDNEEEMCKEEMQYAPDSCCFENGKLIEVKNNIKQQVERVIKEVEIELKNHAKLL